jgi:hypothetical protein
MMENQIEIFTSIDNQTVVQVRFEQDTVWLNQKQLGELFDKDSDTIGLHLKNIFLEEELDENSTTELFSVVQTEGKRGVKRNINTLQLNLNAFSYNWIVTHQNSSRGSMEISCCQERL